MLSLHVEMISRARLILGSDEEICERLAVSKRMLDLWSSGAEAPPTFVFLRLVDLLDDSDRDELARLAERNRHGRSKTEVVAAAARAAREKAEIATQHSAAAQQRAR